MSLLFNFFALIDALQDAQNVDGISTQLKHFKVGFDFILGLLSQLHFFFLSLTKSRILILVIDVGLLPEYSEETAFALFSL